MHAIHQILSRKLADKAITDDEVVQIRERIEQDGKLDQDDVRLLVELYTQADKRSPAFDDLFFSVLEQVILDDGQVTSSEQYFLLKMIYSDREITAREKDFLTRIRKSIKRRSPEFEALCETALSAHPTAWCVGGR